MIFNQTEEKPKIDRSKYTLIIDGNYFAMRIAFATKLTFFEQPNKDSIELMKSYNSAFSSLITELKGSLNRVAFVIDGKSWRKDVKMIVPKSLEHLSQEERQYKANRSKEDSDIDLRVVMRVFREFVEMLDKEFNVPLLQSDRAEGDDLFAAAVEVERNEGRKCLLYASDGDIQQFVDEDVFIYKQMPNDRPNKIVMTKAVKESFHPTVKDDGFAIFGVQVAKTDLLVSQFDKENVVTATPEQFLILKSISGDKKDNIHPTFRWTKIDKNGDSKSFNPTMMYIKKGLEKLDMTIDDLTMEHIYDETFMRNLIKEIVLSCPLGNDLKVATRVYKANIKLMISNGIEPNLYTAIMGDEIYPKILDIKLPCGSVVNFTREMIDSALSKMEEVMKLDTKTLKGTKFPKLFLPLLLDELPILRDLDLAYDIFVQNRTMLHLKKGCIPQYVMDDMLSVCESKKDIVCDLDVISDNRKLMGKTSAKEDIFDGFIETESNTDVIADVNSDVDDIMKSAFDAFGI